MPPIRRRNPIRGRPWLAVAAGGLIGSTARLTVSALATDAAGAFPWAILVVNLAGSFLLGLYLARRERAIESSVPFWAIGVFGSLTTFSTFSLGVVQLLDDGRALMAAVYVAVSLLGGLGVALIGERVGLVTR